ncbi:hypothetical protein ACIQWA_03190 [Kitasatospora sp. NPDC098652]|uniref:hypothetical protein n=1 Tax=Kitasatospora sp. NPDC098652 TaxID=3364095 RepID=UPI00380D7BDB
MAIQAVSGLSKSTAASGPSHGRPTRSPNRWQNAPSAGTGRRGVGEPSRSTNSASAATWSWNRSARDSFGLASAAAFAATSPASGSMPIAAGRSRWSSTRSGLPARCAFTHRPSCSPSYTVSSGSTVQSTRPSESTRTPAGTTHIRDSLTPTGLLPCILRSTRLLTRAAQLDIELLTAALGMSYSGVTPFLNPTHPAPRRPCAGPTGPPAPDRPPYQATPRASSRASCSALSFARRGARAARRCPYKLRMAWLDAVSTVARMQ